MTTKRKAAVRPDAKPEPARVSPSSGNVFADIGLPDADTHELKAMIVSIIAREIAAAGWTQAHAAERLGMTQPDVSKMIRGQFRPMSLERLLLCLIELGRPVTIDVGRLAGKHKKRAPLTVVEA